MVESPPQLLCISLQFGVLDEACVAKDKDLMIQKYKLRKPVFNMKSNFVPDKYHHQSSVTIHLRQPTVERLSSCYSKGWPWVTASTYCMVTTMHQGTPLWCKACLLLVTSHSTANPFTYSDGPHYIIARVPAFCDLTLYCKHILHKSFSVTSHIFDCRRSCFCDQGTRYCIASTPPVVWL